MLERRIRPLLFAFIALFIILGPFYRQIIGGANPLFRQWQMYTDNGVGMISFRFEREIDGTWQRFDYLPTLKRHFKIRKEKRLKLNQIAAFEAIKRQMCTDYGDRALRVFAKRAHRTKGWLELNRGERVNCLKPR